jgi:hypothetical protein
LVLLAAVPSRRIAVLAAWAFGLAHFVAPSLGWDPLVLLVIVALAASVRMPVVRADVRLTEPRRVTSDST